MEILLPYDLMYTNTLAFCSYLDNLSIDEEFTLRMDLNTVEPFGMLLMSSKLRRFIDDNKRKDVKFSRAYGVLNTYAAHMGFYQAANLKIGNEPGEASGSSTYLPITDILVSDIRNEAATKKEHHGQIVTQKSIEIANIISRGNSNVREKLAFAIREIIRNVVEHSRSEKVWIAAQYWPNRGNLVEVAILDEGVGLRTTLDEHPQITVKSDRDALLLAIEPGVTGNHFAYGEDNVWANSGYGLYMTSSICEKVGDFIICSGNQAVKIDSAGPTFFETSFSGTAIRMRFRVQDLQRIDIDSIVNEGQERAARNGGLTRKSASLVSRVLNP